MTSRPMGAIGSRLTISGQSQSSSPAYIGGLAHPLEGRAHVMWVLPTARSHLWPLLAPAVPGLSHGTGQSAARSERCLGSMNFTRAGRVRQTQTPGRRGRCASPNRNIILTMCGRPGHGFSVPGADLDVRATSARDTTDVSLRKSQNNTARASNGRDAACSLLPCPTSILVVECGSVAFHQLAQLELLRQIVERANLLTTPCVIAGLDRQCSHLLARWWPHSGLQRVGHICGNPALFGPH